MGNEKGIILAVTIMFVVSLALVAGVAITLMTNQARVSEYQIRRVKAFYTAEAGIVHAFEQLRNGSSDTSWNVTLNGLTATATYTAVVGPNNTRKLTSSASYITD